MRSLIILFFSLFSFFNLNQDIEGVYIVQDSQISFKSDAPLELIQAESKELAGIINTEKYTFAFTIPMNSFDGFNSALQKEHFRENYLETHKFPSATFKGKMIELINFNKEGVYEVRAKGILNIHGVEQERIIKSTVTVGGNKITVVSNFEVMLEDHNIQIPKVVHQKIAEEIFLELNAEFTKR
jgi:hypothetical protein